MGGVSDLKYVLQPMTYGEECNSQVTVIKNKITGEIVRYYLEVFDRKYHRLLLGYPCPSKEDLFKLAKERFNVEPTIDDVN